MQGPAVCLAAVPHVSLLAQAESPTLGAETAEAGLYLLLLAKTVAN